MKTIALSLLLLIAGSRVFAETPSADQVMAKAKIQASAEHKNILLHFGASWCGWCGKLENFLERPEVKPILNKYFVEVKLVVKEEEPKKNLDNPGADELMKKLGESNDVPFTVLLDPTGTLIANSKPPTDDNIGFPVGPKEIGLFLQMLQKAAPQLSKKELATLEASLKQIGK